ncbi:hypothetical protein GJ496_007995 [Pomphorhynchus laevis]|nr:hypothetical protein GJ496_007995 [Pomphorhynchus laevis]
MTPNQGCIDSVRMSGKRIWLEDFVNRARRSHGIAAGDTKCRWQIGFRNDRDLLQRYALKVRRFKVSIKRRHFNISHICPQVVDDDELKTIY